MTFSRSKKTCSSTGRFHLEWVCVIYGLGLIRSLKKEQLCCVLMRKFSEQFFKTAKGFVDNDFGAESEY